MDRRLLIALSPLLAASVPASAQGHFEMPPPELAQPHAGGVRVTADGLVANWYAPGPSSKGTILLLGGSEGGIGSGVARQSDDLIAHGFAVLQLAYFGAPGLPPKLDRVPLEYFDRALAWIEKQPGIGAGRIGIVGASKGAEAALLVAARHAEVKAVVVGAPSAAVWPGIDFAGGPTGSSWSLAGRPLPYLRYGSAATSMFTAYRSGLASLPAHRAAAIPVRSIRARVLLVCGEADTLWPSCPMSRMVVRDMAGRAELLAYPDAGHAVFGPPVPVGAPGYASLGTLGGSPAGNAAGRLAAWPRAIAFLERTLAPG